MPFFSDTLHFWLARFDVEQFLFIPSHRLADLASAKELKTSISKVLGITHYGNKTDLLVTNTQTSASYKKGMRENLPEVSKLLDQFFKPEKQRLSMLTGLSIEELYSSRS